MHVSLYLASGYEYLSGLEFPTDVAGLFAAERVHGLRETRYNYDDDEASATKTRHAQDFDVVYTQQYVAGGCMIFEVTGRPRPMLNPDRSA